MEKKYILAIDQGTTTTKVVIFDREGIPVSNVFREIRQIYPNPGWVEHDPREYWETTKDCISEALKTKQIRPEEIMAIGITMQRETTILWNKSTGEPYHNAINWQCRRTIEICEDLKAQGYERMVREKTGIVIDPYFSGTKIRWILDNVPGLRQKAEAGEVCFGTVDTWLLWHLSGGQVHATDYTNASRTMLFNVKEIKWDDELLAMLEIPREILPETRPSSGIFGYTSPELFDGVRIPIAGIAGDQHAATFGQTCFKPGMAKNTYGTSLAMVMNIGDQFILSDHGVTTDLGWGINDHIVYAFEGVVFVGGAVVQWLRDGLHIIEHARETEKMAQMVPDSGGIYIVPAFTGLCTPYWDSYARGTIVGITRGTTREHFARAALESIAYQTKDVLDAMVADSGHSLDSLRVDGRAVGNDFLMQFQADILGVPVQRPVVTDMAALGAAYMAGLAVGFWEDTDQLVEQWKVDRTFEPTMPDEKRQELYNGWKRAVERSLGWARKR